MTEEEVDEMFESEDVSKEFLKFDRIEKKFSNRPDLHAFILLDKLFPSNRDMVSCAEHDEIFLDIFLRDFARVATKELIIELHRCGVRSNGEGLCMFA